jgi:hypothetical protein
MEAILNSLTKMSQKLKWPPFWNFKFYQADSFSTVALINLNIHTEFHKKRLKNFKDKNYKKNPKWRISGKPSIFGINFIRDYLFILTQITISHSFALYFWDTLYMYRTNKEWRMYVQNEYIEWPFKTLRKCG